jgi:hypothetical protein
MCRNATALLQYCATESADSEAPLFPALRTLNIASPSSDRPFCIEVNALNTFLTCISPLTNLLLSLALVPSSQPTVRGLHAQALTKHAATLEYAYLDVARHDPEAFVKELAKCKQMKQLALPNLGRAFALTRSSPSEMLGGVAMVSRDDNSVRGED